MLSRERWIQLEDVYHAARELSVERRGQYLSQVFSGDDGLKQEVESLLAQDVESGAFLERSALDAAPIAADLSGRALGAYKLVSLIGSGGMGDVYLAVDSRLGRKVAVKVLPPEYSASELRIERFTEEARAASALNHPHIVTIYDVGLCEGTHFIVMEYIAGGTLASRIVPGGLPAAHVLTYARSIADAMTAVHAVGILHRDLKPSNIMISQSGEVKILDFGLSGASRACTDGGHRVPSTGASSAGGTAAYMSPERIQGQPADERSDIFSFGAVLYEMTTGRRAFEGGSESAVLAAVRTAEPAVLTGQTGLGGVLNRIAVRCLNKDPARRFQTMAEVSAVLEATAREEETRLRRVESLMHLRRRLAAIALAAGPAAAMLAFAWARFKRALRNPARVHLSRLRLVCGRPIDGYGERNFLRSDLAFVILLHRLVEPRP